MRISGLSNVNSFLVFYFLLVVDFILPIIDFSCEVSLAFVIYLYLLIYGQSHQHIIKLSLPDYLCLAAK